MRRSVNYLLIPALVVTAAVVYFKLKPPEPTVVQTSRSERVDKLSSVVSASGEIRAKVFVDIQAEVAAIITELLVREGDAVKQGDILLRLDDTQLMAEVNGAKALFAASESEVKSAEVAVATAEANLAFERTAAANIRIEQEQALITLERAKASFARKKDLFDKQLLNAEEYEVAEAESRLSRFRLDFAKARVDQGDANVRAAQSRVEAARTAKEGAQRRGENSRAIVARAEDLLSKTVMRAPISGSITKLNVEKGERAVPGIQSNPLATLMTIADMSVIEAEIRVNETDFINVALGNKADVKVDALRDQKLSGVVTEIGQSPIQSASGGGGSSSNGGMSSSQEAKDFKVVVRLEDPPSSLRPGLSATAAIITAVKEHVLVIPLQALTAREVEVDEQGNYVPPPREEKAMVGVLSAQEPRRKEKKKELDGVFLVEAGLARFHPLKTGIQGEMDVEVTEGLAENVEVILGPSKVLQTLKEWDAVRVENKQKNGGQFGLGKKQQR
jgi:HlyD family secretion protein